MKAAPMSEDKLKYFEQLLQDEKQKTKQTIDQITDRMKKGIEENSGDLSSFSIHQADVSSSHSGLETETSLLEIERNKLLEINHALGKIYDKTYGICEESGEMISEKRLKAIPWARYTIAAIEKMEGKKKGNYYKKI